ncbi:alcohol oxidase-like protein [Hypoxylon cercidicola]|nr:alcohol oxidase-like protein [Hypoxylon cercidicola]
MGLYSKLPGELEEVDVIVAGGGSAGCIIASRLSDADPNLSILLIESGTNNYENPSIVYPAFIFDHIKPGNKYTTFYKGNKSDLLNDRELMLVTGGVLGGGSSINMVLYSRAQRSDIDGWKTPGWSADDLLHYMRKLETYHGPGKADRHGFDGPIHVSEDVFRVKKWDDEFMKSINRAGWPEIEDMNDLDNINGATRALRYVDSEGKRQDTAHRYLHPRLQDGKHPNLHVLIESSVERVLFEGQKAVGVVYTPNPSFQPSVAGSENPSRTIKARKMVVVSCGAVGTPLVLQRSGVGDPKVLERAGVPTVADVPGVGRDYEDHQIMLYGYKSDLPPEETLDAFNSGRLDREALVANKDKILSWNSFDIQCKLRPTEADVTALGPEFREVWDREFKNIPDKAWQLLIPVQCFPGDSTGFPIEQYLGAATYPLFPLSRGHVRITGPKLDDQPDFDLGFLSDYMDMKNHLWGYKKQREIMRRIESYRGEIPELHPPFPAGSKAACIETDTPHGDVADIEYTADDDAIIEKWVREHVDTAWHPVGSCKMLPYEKGGAVDPALNVYGVENLKVADLSILPTNVGSNPYNTAMAIGEKAADMIIQELGLGK